MFISQTLTFSLSWDIWSTNLFRINGAVKMVKTELKFMFFVLFWNEFISYTKNKSKLSFDHFSKCAYFCAMAVGWRSLWHVHSTDLIWNFVVRITDWTSHNLSAVKFCLTCSCLAIFGISQSYIQYNFRCAYETSNSEDQGFDDVLRYLSDLQG